MLNVTNALMSNQLDDMETAVCQRRNVKSSTVEATTTNVAFDDMLYGSSNKENHKPLYVPKTIYSLVTNSAPKIYVNNSFKAQWGNTPGYAKDIEKVNHNLNEMIMNSALVD